MASKALFLMTLCIIKILNVKNIVCILILGLISWSLMADNVLSDPNASEIYIETFKEIAISEMERTGIPASIKLAQGLLESGAGKSTLSREAKNHFGIKCGGSWTGKTYKHKDDDYVNGKLIKSCFRKFNSAHESYIAHSDFLQTQRRYATLFDLSKQDYYSWAKGLKKAGYATDPAYAQKLIDLIEKYQLYLHDDAALGYEIADNDKGEKKGKKKDISKPDNNQSDIAEVDTPKETSRGRAKSRRPSSKNTSRSRKGSDKVTHKVRQGETIASIAESYGLDATVVRLRNRIPKDAEPLPGEKIHLRKKFSVFKRPKFTRSVSEDVAIQEEFIF